MIAKTGTTVQSGDELAREVGGALGGSTTQYLFEVLCAKTTERYIYAKWKRNCETVLDFVSICDNTFIPL